MKKTLKLALILAVSVVAITGCDLIEKAKNAVGQGAENVSAKLDEGSSDTTSSYRKLMGINDSVAEKLQAKENGDSVTPQPNNGLTPVYMGMWGKVGGTGFLFDMDGTTGSYIPYDMADAKEYGARRQLKLVSYDDDSGKCVINAYLEGKYIGQFSGVFVEDKIESDEGDFFVQSYNGVFTSVKGARLDFTFYYD